jgi:predicted ABC-type ATPase
MSDGAETIDALRERLSSDDCVLVVVAGPNGAGKTTFVETFLKTTGLRIVNPDQIARALSPDAPDTVAYEAAQLADTVRRDLVSRRISFCMETVFSDPDGAKVAFLREARSQGYVVFLVFIGLSSGDLAIARVVQRTEAGGHDVPDEKVTARFPRTFENLRQAITFVDHALLFDNSSADEPYRFIAEFAGAKVVRQGSYRCAWAADLLVTRISE